LNIVAIAAEATDWYLETNELAMKRGLTMYDAAYLHLAVKARRRLATADRKRGAAATAEGRAF
jgi:predicted nucleic acid-binding protein